MPAPSAVDRVNTVLYCRRFAETVAFYRDRLGFAASLDREWFVELEVCPGARISVADERRASVPSAGGAGLTLTLRVGDVDAVRDRLAASGLEPEPVRAHPWGARLFRIRDPEGNRVEFWSEGS